jgi:hypothetical protein
MGGRVYPCISCAVVPDVGVEFSKVVTPTQHTISLPAVSDVGEKLLKVVAATQDSLTSLNDKQQRFDSVVRTASISLDRSKQEKLFSIADYLKKENQIESLELLDEDFIGKYDGRFVVGYFPGDRVDFRLDNVTFQGIFDEAQLRYYSSKDLKVLN